MEINTLTTASFMTVGLLDYKAERDVAEGRSVGEGLYARWDKGACKLHAELCRYAPVSSKLLEYIDKNYEYAYLGVYDYEVSETFGAWFAKVVDEYCEAPVEEDACAHLIELIAEFFSQGDDIIRAGLIGALTAVLPYLKVFE